jgi:hypothetical protein
MLQGCTEVVRRSAGRAVSALALATALLTAYPPNQLTAQKVLDQFTSENLRLSGIGVDFGVLGGTDIRGTARGAVRLDFGTVAPRARVLLGVSYFRAGLSGAALQRYAQRVRSLVKDPTGDDTISLGRINWSDLTGDLDLQYVLPQSRAVTAYMGLGASVHLRNGSGAAINGTFVEDALDAITAGINVTLGAEFGTGRWRLALDARGVAATGLSTVGVSAGLRYRWAGAAAARAGGPP